MGHIGHLDTDRGPITSAVKNDNIELPLYFDTTLSTMNTALTGDSALQNLKLAPTFATSVLNTQRSTEELSADVLQSFDDTQALDALVTVLGNLRQRTIGADTVVNQAVLEAMTHCNYDKNKYEAVQVLSVEQEFDVTGVASDEYPDNGILLDTGDDSLVVDQNGNAIQLTNRPAVGGYATTFDGVNQSISSTPISGAMSSITSDFTIAAWVKTGLNADLTGRTIMGAGDASTTGFWLRGTGSGNLTFSVYGGTTATRDYVFDDSDINDGHWHLIMVQYDDTGNEVRVFVDAILVSTQTTDVNTHAAPSGDLAFGVNPNAASDYWQGQMQLPAIWLTNALDATAAFHWYHAGFASISSAPDRVYHFDADNVWELRGIGQTNSEAITAANTPLVYQAQDVPVVWYDDYGFIERSGVKVPARYDTDGVSTTHTADNLEGTLGEAAYDAKLIDANCWTFDGVSQHATEASLTGAETVTSSEGTSTPSISAGQIDFTAGTCYNLVLSNGSEYPMAEGAGTTAYDVSGNGRHLTLVNSPTVGTQDTHHYNVTKGFTDSGGVKIPALKDKSNGSDGNPIAAAAQVGHNGAESKIDFTNGGQSYYWLDELYEGHGNFDGLTSWVDLDHNMLDTSQDFTLKLDFRTSTLSGNQVIFARAASATDKLFVVREGSSLRLQMYDGADHGADWTIVADTWYSLTAVWDSVAGDWTTVTLNDQAATGSTAAQSTDTNAPFMTLGSVASGGAYGSIHLYDGDLAKVEIVQGVIVLDLPLISNTLDWSGQNNHGANTGVTFDRITIEEASPYTYGDTLNCPQFVEQTVKDKFIIMKPIGPKQVTGTPWEPPVDPAENLHDDFALQATYLKDVTPDVDGIIDDETATHVGGPAIGGLATNMGVSYDFIWDQQITKQDKTKLSVGAWIYIDSDFFEQMVVTEYDGSYSHAWDLKVNEYTNGAGSMTVTITESGNLFGNHKLYHTPSGLITASTWHHVAFDWSASSDTIRMFIDGEQVPDASLTKTQDDTIATIYDAAGFEVGCQGGSTHLTGKMSMVMLSDDKTFDDVDARSAGEAVRDLYLNRNTAAFLPFATEVVRLAGPVVATQYRPVKPDTNVYSTDVYSGSDVPSDPWDFNNLGYSKGTCLDTVSSNLTPKSFGDWYKEDSKWKSTTNGADLELPYLFKPNYHHLVVVDVATATASNYVRIYDTGTLIGNLTEPGVWTVPLRSGTSNIELRVNNDNVTEVAVNSVQVYQLEGTTSTAHPARVGTNLTATGVSLTSNGRAKRNARYSGAHCLDFNTASSRLVWANSGGFDFSANHWHMSLKITEWTVADFDTLFHIGDSVNGKHILRHYDRDIQTFFNGGSGVGTMTDFLPHYHVNLTTSEPSKNCEELEDGMANVPGSYMMFEVEFDGDNTLTATYTLFKPGHDPIVRVYSRTGQGPSVATAFPLNIGNGHAFAYASAGKIFDVTLRSDDDLSVDFWWPICEGAGNTCYDVKSGEELTMTNAAWTTQDLFCYERKYGYTDNAGTIIPALEDGSNDAQGNPIGISATSKNVNDHITVKMGDSSGNVHWPLMLFEGAEFNGSSSHVDVDQSFDWSSNWVIESKFVNDDVASNNPLIGSTTSVHYVTRVTSAAKLAGKLGGSQLTHTTLVTQDEEHDAVFTYLGGANASLLITLDEVQETKTNNSTPTDTGDILVGNNSGGQWFVGTMRDTKVTASSTVLYDTNFAGHTMDLSSSLNHGTATDITFTTSADITHSVGRYAVFVTVDGGSESEYLVYGARDADPKNTPSSLLTDLRSYLHMSHRDGFLPQVGPLWFKSGTTADVDTANPINGRPSTQFNSGYFSIDHATAASNSLVPTGPFTINCWIKQNGGVSGGGCVVAISDNNATDRIYQLRYSHTDQQIRFFLTDDVGGSHQLSQSVTLDTDWHMLTAQWDGSTIRVKLDNGSWLGNVSFSGTLNNTYTGDLTIGGSSNQVSARDLNNAHLYGLGIWSRALTDAEVTSLYNSGTPLDFPFFGS